MKRNCRNCLYCNASRKECEEGGFTEIGDIDRELTEEDCNAWKPVRKQEREAQARR